MTILSISSAKLIVVSFICSLLEVALLSFNPLRLETLKKEGRRHASIWLNMKQNLARPIAAILNTQPN